MAELALFTGSGEKWQDGDVVDAFNNKRIQKHYPGSDSWHFSDRERQFFLILKVDDFTEAVRSVWMEEGWVDTGVLDQFGNKTYRLDRRRSYNIDYRSLLTSKQISDAESNTIIGPSIDIVFANSIVRGK